MQIHSKSAFMVMAIKILIKIVTFDGIVEKWNSVLKAIVNIYSLVAGVGYFLLTFYG